MPNDELKQVAAALRAQHGVLAKREAVRYMIQASSEGLADAEVLWRSVTERLIQDEQDDPNIYTSCSNPILSSTDILIKNLEFAVDQTLIPSAENWNAFRSSARKAARHIRALETAVAQLLSDQEGARFTAVKLLVISATEDQED